MFADISKSLPGTFGVILVAAAIVDITILFIIRYLPILLGNHSYKDIRPVGILNRHFEKNEDLKCPCVEIQ